MGGSSLGRLKGSTGSICQLAHACLSFTTRIIGRGALDSNGHRFGGTWTELKLDVIEGYLNFYARVLANRPSPNRPFKRWYIDAFAGSGSRTVEVTAGGMLEGVPSRVEEIELAGSARRALQVDPPFHRFVFIEGNRGRFRDLQRLKDDHADRLIDCYPGDSNEVLCKLFASPPWSFQKEGRGDHRAVTFLDPYGMSVRWSTLEMLAQTRSVDVWYLFPLEAVNRQLSGDLERVDESKQLKLDEIFGTTEWRKDLYQTAAWGGLFGETIEQTTKVGSKREIEAYALKRLATVFSYVSEPIRLTGAGRGQIFSLICLANPATHAATALIKKGVQWLHDHYAYEASRRTSGH